MKRENELALIVAYYLSRYDQAGYQGLGYSSFNDVFRSTEKTLGVKANTVKNMRDEFDPLHETERVGWYQRPLPPSRAAVVEAFQDIPEPTLRDVVKDILTSSEFRKTSSLGEQLKTIATHERRQRVAGAGVFVPRGKTGRMAEEFFARMFKEGKFPVRGELIDSRDLGQGYDYKIVNSHGEIYIEVKGLVGSDGGILFTDREWRSARENGDRFGVVVVLDVGTPNPRLVWLRNPAASLEPVRNFATSITVNWAVQASKLGRAILKARDSAISNAQS